MAETRVIETVMYIGMSRSAPGKLGGRKNAAPLLNASSDAFIVGGFLKLAKWLKKTIADFQSLFMAVPVSMRLVISWHRLFPKSV